MAAPAKTIAPPEPGLHNGAGDARLAEAVDALARARAHVRALDAVRDDPTATRLARLSAERDLIAALTAEQTAEIAQLECAEEVRAARERHRAEMHALHEPAIRATGAAFQTALEELLDGPYRDLVAALTEYQGLVGTTYKYAVEMAVWPQTAEMIAFRRKNLTTLGLLD
jgi:CHASE2 domain-containing sensor protein